MQRKILRYLDENFGSLLCFIVSLFGYVPKVLNSNDVGEKEDFKNILVVKIVGLGDAVLILPSIKALREAYPKARISALATPLTKDIFTGQDSLDEVIVADFNKWGTYEGIRDFIRLFFNLRRKNFDLVVDFDQYLRLITILLYFTGAREIVGFSNKGQKRGFLLTKKASIDPNKHMVEGFIELVRAVGVKKDKITALEKIWVSEEDKNYVNRWLLQNGISDGDLLVGIHSGSGPAATSRRWTKEGFAKIADQVINVYNAKLMFTGAASELKRINEILSLMNNTAFTPAGDFSLKQSCALIEKLNLLISNDTGIMHVGAAMGTPTIGLFGPNTPIRYAPYGEKNLAIYKNIECSPCINVHLGQVPKCDNPKCMKLITLQEVWEAIEKQLKITS